MTSGPMDTRSTSGNGHASRDGLWGVVFLAHGSQRGASPAECSCFWQSGGSGTPEWCRHCPSTPTGLQDAADRLQISLGQDRARVVLTCLEFIEPHPDQTVHRMAEQGLSRVVVVPYLLGQGKHVTLEMDEILGALRAELPHLRLYLAESLGPDPRMADIVTERVRAQAEYLPARDQGKPTGVLLVKAGTKNQYDDCVWLEELGRMVEMRLGLGYAVAIAQSHYGDPTVEAGAARLVDDLGVASIIVVPYIFFPGLILKRNVLGGMDRLQKLYPGVSLAVTPPLGVDDRLVAVAADHIRRVWDQVENDGT